MEEQASLEAAVCSVTADAGNTTAMMTDDGIEYVEVAGVHNDIDPGQLHNSTIVCSSENVTDLALASGHDAAAQQAAAAVLSSRFFTEEKRRQFANRRHGQRLVRKEVLKPVEVILRRCKKLINRVYTICPLCRFFSSNYGVLLRHLMIHREERPFACPHCEATFKLPELLLDHLRQHHHAGTPKVCFLSNLEAKSPAKLRRAEFRLVHRSLRTCAVCAEHCFTEHDLLTHVQELHGLEALRNVRKAARAVRRRNRVRMRRKFVRVPLRKRKRSRVNGNSGSARTGGGGLPRSKRTKFLSNNEHQTSLVVCDGEVLIEEGSVDWAKQVFD